MKANLGWNHCQWLVVVCYSVSCGTMVVWTCVGLCLCLASLMPAIISCSLVWIEQNVIVYACVHQRSLPALECLISFTGAPRGMVMVVNGSKLYERSKNAKVMSSSVAMVIAIPLHLCRCSRCCCCCFVVWLGRSKLTPRLTWYWQHGGVPFSRSTIVVEAIFSIFVC
jgi:hypothetical protein